MNEIWKCLLIYQFNIWNCCMNHIIIYLWIHALLFDYRFNCMHINIYENMHSNLINLIACIYRYIRILHGKILDLFAYIVKGICDICLKDILIMLLIIDLMCYIKVLTYGVFPCSNILASVSSSLCWTPFIRVSSCTGSPIS